MLVRPAPASSVPTGKPFSAAWIPGGHHSPTFSPVVMNRPRRAACVISLDATWPSSVVSCGNVVRWTA